MATKCGPGSPRNPSEKLQYGQIPDRYVVENELSGMSVELPCDMENTDDPITHIGYHPVGLAGEKGTDSDQDEKDPGLDRNPAYTGSIFTDSHPYVAGAYPGAQGAVKRFIKTIGDLKHA